MEWVVEFAFTVIDYSYLLYFYLILIQQKWDWKKALLGILAISIIQFSKDQYFSFGAFSNAVDTLLITGYLFVYAKQHTLNYYFYALLIEGLFDFSITLFVSLALEFGINISDTLIFGSYRIIFTVCLKLFVVLVLWMMVKFLVKNRIQEMDTERSMVAITAGIVLLFSYVLGLAMDNTETLFYTILLSIVMVTILYIFYRYCRLLQNQSEIKIIENSIRITSDYVAKLEKEHDNIRKIRHDMKNQLSTLAILLEDDKYQEAKEVLNGLNEEIDSAHSAISGNIFVDAVLRQKMSEYDDINFKLTARITNDCVMDGKYIISLLSNIIDNACEELRRVQQSSLILNISANKTQMIITEQNACRGKIDLITDKDKREHGYGLKIIKEIANKYHGKVITKVSDGLFEIKVLLLFIDGK